MIPTYKLRQFNYAKHLFVYSLYKFTKRFILFALIKMQTRAAIVVMFT